MTDHASAEVAAVETVGGVLTDLVEVAEMLPVQPGRAGDVARILDRLAEEIGEAAGMLRVVSGTVSAPAGPAYNPWGVARLVTRELAREGVKSLFGPAADLSEVGGHAARLLEALGVVPVVPADDAAGLSAAFPPWRSAPAGRPRIDGSIPAGGDERVTRARELIAEHRQPITMTPGDLRTLLARFQRRPVELLGSSTVRTTSRPDRHQVARSRRIPRLSATPIGRRRTRITATTPAGHASECTNEATKASQLTG